MPGLGSSRFKIVFSLVLVLSWAGLLFYLHILPGEDLHLDTWWFKYHMDKWAHAFMFMIFFILSVNFLRCLSVPKIKGYVLSGIMVVLYGALMEWIQGSMIEGRVADPLDFLADSAGIVFGMITIRIFYWFRWWS